MDQHVRFLEEWKIFLERLEENERLRARLADAYRQVDRIRQELVVSRLQRDTLRNEFDLLSSRLSPVGKYPSLS